LINTIIIKVEIFVKTLKTKRNYNLSAKKKKEARLKNSKHFFIMAKHLKV
jgi:hypothetical protein